MNAPLPRKPWSISALKGYEQCPRRYYEVQVIKNFSEKPSESMAWGDTLHKAFDKYLVSKEQLPIGMRQYAALLDWFRAQPGEKLVEQKLAISDQFQPTTWFGKNVWVRSIVDLACVNGNRALLIDWKTGKVKEDFDQLALMAGVMFNHAEELEQITAMFVWLQEWDPADPSKAFSKATYTRDELPVIWDRFLRREEVFQDAHRKTEFPPKPGGLCRSFCPVSTCPYHGG